MQVDAGAVWGAIRAGLTYEQNALLRAYGAETYEKREMQLDRIARDIVARVERDAHTREPK